MPFKELKQTFNQCLQLFKSLAIPKGEARINIGGGEPFLNRDLFRLLGIMKRYSKDIKIQLMSNGYFINDAVAKNLVKMNISSVQVSLEGLRDTNDSIRGKGSFDKIVNAVSILRKNNIITRVSLTLTRKNINEVEQLAVYLKSLGVKTFGIRRYVKAGQGKELKDFMLDPPELKNHYEKRMSLKKALEKDRRFFITYGCEDAMFCAQASPSHQYACGIVTGHHLNIFTNGDILSCRRCPIVLGNVLRDSLLDVYFSSDKLWNLRNLNNSHLFCRKCSYFKYCLGGAKCISYSYFGNPFAPDPQCFRIFENLPKVNEFKKCSDKLRKPIRISGGCF
jgi:radical SAM protein with 4Fe4S-binding SPASM domain